jgi:hypothetical protein
MKDWSSLRNNIPCGRPETVWERAEKRKTAIKAMM